MSGLSARDALTTAALHRMFADETDAFDEFVANHKRLDLDYLTDCADGMCRAARRQADDVLAVLSEAGHTVRDEAAVKAEALEEAVASGEFPGLTLARDWVAARAVALRAGEVQ